MHRKSLIAAGVSVALCAASVVTLTGAASAESRYWTHPMDEFGDPTADIRAYSLALDTSVVRASVALGAFDLASAQSSTFVVELDNNGDGVADWHIRKEDAASVSVRRGDYLDFGDPVSCPSAQVSYNASNKSVSFSAGVACIGNPSSVRGNYYYSVAEGADFAPAIDRFSPAVSNQPDATTSPTPSPTSPPPTTARATGRLAGGDRYATAVAISRNVFPNGAPVVFLARADAFADALAGGSLSRGPVLLVPKCGAVPAVVKQEVRRLGAGEVVALGGSGAVCDAVLAEIAHS